MRINYVEDSLTHTCLTKCPNRLALYVGSCKCGDCEYFSYMDSFYKFVSCNYDEPTEKAIEGHSAYRMNNSDSYNDLERAYFYSFKELCRTGFDINYFGGMNDRGTEAKRYLTDEEKRIILTVIQWLGTPVGQTFLEEVK